MKVLICAIALMCAFLSSFAEEVRLLDLEPTDAQQIIEKQDTTLKYAPKVDSNVPAVRFLGNEPHNVLEDIYLANQYHGQDGLGGYLYGYAVPDIAKTEKKKAGGDLRGAYNYIAGNGQEIKVEYWDDGTGFHQIDNVPRILPEQIPDTPEVAAAKAEHARIWHEQAERNSKPIANPYDSQGNYAQGPLSPQGQQQRQQQFQQQGYQKPQGQVQQLVNTYQQQKQHFPNPGGQNVHYQGGQYQPQQTQNVNKYQQPGSQFSGSQSSAAGQFSTSQPGSGSQSGSGGLSGTGGQYAGSQSGSASLTGSGGQYSGSQSGVGSGLSGSGGQHPGGQSGSGVGSGSQLSGTGSGFGREQASGGLSGSGSQSGIGGGQYSGSQQGKYSGGLSGSGTQSGIGGGQYSGGQQGQYSGGLSGSGGQYSGGYQASASHSSGQYDSAAEERKWAEEESKWDAQEGQWDGKEEEQGPPKGFFYKFDYPVGIIVSKDGGSVQKRESDLKDIYASNKATFEKQLQEGHGDGASSSSGYLAV